VGVRAEQDTKAAKVRGAKAKERVRGKYYLIDGQRVLVMPGSFLEKALDIGVIPASRKSAKSKARYFIDEKGKAVFVRKGSCLDLAWEQVFPGGDDDSPRDLSCNKEHMEGYGTE
jgi:hypothetical protein